MPEIHKLEKIWARRAAQLAQPLEQEKLKEHIELILVKLGQEIYAFPSRHILYIKPAARITRVPGAPDWLCGIVNQRGRILSVINLQRLYNPSQAAAGLTGAYLVFAQAANANVQAVLPVDDILDIATWPMTHLQSAQDALRGPFSHCVQGLVEWDADEERSLVIVLDLATLLTDEQLLVGQKGPLSKELEHER